MGMKVFGNYEYIDASYDIDKKAANQLAKKYRSDGRKVKVIKEGNYYVVYASTYNTKTRKQM